MPKKKRSRRRSAFRAFRRRARKATKRTNLVQVDAMIYGALRERVSNALTTITGRIPLGDVADEVGMGLVNWFVAKNMKGMVRDVALKGLVIENARLGEAIATGSILGNLTGGTAQSADNSVKVF